MQALAAGGVIQVIDYGVNLRRADDAVLRVAGGVLLAEGLEAAGMNIAAAATDSVPPGDLSVSSEDTVLRIQPPSTGEPVQAARPGSVAEAANAIADVDAAENSVKTEAANEGNAPAPETTTHNG